MVAQLRPRLDARVPPLDDHGCVGVMEESLNAPRLHKEPTMPLRHLT